jgi:hypothetical protein
MRLFWHAFLAGGLGSRPAEARERTAPWTHFVNTYSATHSGPTGRARVPQEVSG